MVFKEELCKKVGEKIGIVGMVLCLTNLGRLDYSDHSGVSFRIESEAQVMCIGKAEDLGICKGAPKGASANLLPVMQLGNHLQCNRFFNKSAEKACEEHKFMEAESKMAIIRSGRASLHSDFIDLNMSQKQILREQQDKNKGSLSSRMFGNSIRTSIPKKEAPPQSD